MALWLIMQQGPFSTPNSLRTKIAYPVAVGDPVFARKRVAHPEKSGLDAIS